MSDDAEDLEEGITIQRNWRECVPRRVLIPNKARQPCGDGQASDCEEQVSRARCMKFILGMQGRNDQVRVIRAWQSGNLWFAWQAEVNGKYANTSQGALWFEASRCMKACVMGPFLEGREH